MNRKKETKVVYFGKLGKLFAWGNKIHKVKYLIIKESKIFEYIQHKKRMCYEYFTLDFQIL